MTDPARRALLRDLAAERATPGGQGHRPFRATAAAPLSAEQARDLRRLIGLLNELLNQEGEPGE